MSSYHCCCPQNTALQIDHQTVVRLHHLYHGNSHSVNTAVLYGHHDYMGIMIIYLYIMWFKVKSYLLFYCWNNNKANLRDLIAATGLVILLKSGSNHSFFILYELEIRWITLKNNRAPFLGHIKLCTLFQSHQWIQTGVTIQKCSIQVKMANFLSHLALKFDTQHGHNIINRASLLCYFKLCAWFHCHMWIQTGVTVRKRLTWVLTSVTLTFDLWPWPFAWKSLLSMVIAPKNFMMI